MNNPWKDLSRLTQIRVADTSNHNLYWFKDAFDSFGLLIQCRTGTFTESHSITLKGIQIEIDNSVEPSKLLLILKDQEDWEIFKILCDDLIGVVSYELDDTLIIEELSKRLNRWQKLLQYELKIGISIQKQRGLFSELLLLKRFVAERYGYNEAVDCWTGPDHCKQDFICNDSAIEVKSYNSSRGRYVKVSSVDQLDSTKKNLYLAAVALSENQQGEDISDVIEEIKMNLNFNTLLKFENKLGEYGYFPEILQEPLQKYIADTIYFYEVKESFPRIIPVNISSAINKVEYEINLSKCELFKISSEEIIL
ncbi:PD-(D/E)XK motif protein [Sporosarcina aquimarina]|uniref:PD-(D/E)XK motif protein n=1 Tax=Sporosarcina aquimarina TaxID=114975 RepID=A0ABU4G2F3_9BACL|nr:PD-(D/E)XK motif protein [Sporosarcina aquimarina]MDW0111138.1 PD-(D/E)XK motif protein [Sporosarcina aquimarina]